jgi:hypothetical protein
MSNGHQSRSSRDGPLPSPAPGPPDQTVQVTGTVRDESGQAVEGAVLSMSSPERPVIELGVVSGPGGHFELPPLLPGHYAVETTVGERGGRLAFEARPRGPNVIEFVIKLRVDTKEG